MNEAVKRRAYVVGGSGGLGSAICEVLARDGWDLIFSYRRNQEHAAALAEKLREKGSNVELRQLDLPDGDPGSFQGLDALVFAAGADIEQPYISEADPEALQSALDLEVRGFFNIVKAALPDLRESQGSVVVLSSAGLGRFPPGDILSVAPKAAVEAIVKGLAREEGRYGVRANALAVGVVDGGVFQRIDWKPETLEAMKKNIPLRRFADASEVAEVVAFLVSSQAGYVTGQTLFVDGGYSV